MAQFIAVAGLPRAGSTFLCQLLAQHPDIHCPAVTSPLADLIKGMSKITSNNPAFLAQLDTTPDIAYGNLKRAMQSALAAWTATDKKVTVDKSRAWLGHIEILLHLNPEAKIVVCVRELGQLYSSMELQHQKTILIAQPDGLAELDPIARGETLFHREGMVGTCLTYIQVLTSMNPELLKKLYILKFEDFMAAPSTVIQDVYAWAGVPSFEIDLQNLKTTIPESDSHWRLKYLHKQKTCFTPPEVRKIPTLIQAQLEKQYDWYYKLLYGMAT